MQHYIYPAEPEVYQHKAFDTKYKSSLASEGTFQGEQLLPDQSNIQFIEHWIINAKLTSAIE